MVCQLVVSGGREPRVLTEAPFDRVAKWLSVYATGLLAIFLIFKEHVLDSALVCQPINRYIRDNLSYNQAQASYDRAYCAASMMDYTHNIIRATADTARNVPGVTVIGIKGKPEEIYQRIFPFTMLLQAFFAYCPVLLWKLWSNELLTAAVNHVSITCKGLLKPSGSPRMESTPKTSPRLRPSGEYQKNIGKLDMIVLQWLDQKYLTTLYISKLVLTQVILIFSLSAYICCVSLFISNFKSQFICRVDDQYLVTCSLSSVELYKTIWLFNIALIDISILITTFQFFNILCCMSRKRNFFFLTYAGIGPSKQSCVTDAHLISYFCHHNLSIMPEEILLNPAVLADSRPVSSTMVTFDGETGEECENSDTVSSFHTASDVAVPAVRSTERRKYSTTHR
ncbi:uncharacterized protein LOC5502737 [Nematostella vectensis]|uniref:uncharacterized protein LOC5502737 n=1 Tax=Nematostella vectensis TaxID=45351 RepID=UPI00207781BF|nr:uncharacterized protein LOC5502737 [Nematostella vectensis]